MEPSTTFTTFTIVNRSQDAGDSCQRSIRIDLFVHFSLIPAVLITLLLSYLQKRARHQKTTDKVPLGKRFGIVVPVNFINSHSNRWSYGAACGATATSVFLLFFNKYSGYFHFKAPPWAEVFVYLLSALEVGLNYYPFFACLSSNHKLISSSLGFCYALSWFCVQVADVFDCWQMSEETLCIPVSSVLLAFITHRFFYQESIIRTFTPIPSLVCCLFLMGKFLYILVNAVIVLNKTEVQQQENDEPLLPKHLSSYVRHLLQSSSEIRQPVQGSSIVQKIYVWDPYFKFPTRMIVTAILCLTCLYNFVLLDFFFAPKVVQSLEEVSLGAVNHTYANRTKSYILMIQDNWFYTTFPSIFTSVIYIFHLLSYYRNQLRKLYRGASKISFTSSPPLVLAASIRYAGNQIAYLLWGYFLLHILFFLIGILITFVFIIPIKEGKGMRILHIFGYIVLGIALLIFVSGAQVLASQFCFLQDKLSPTDKAKPLAINNRRAFQNFSYFFMFYSAILGFGTCLIRVTLNVFLGSWLLARIDRPLFPRGYECADMGYNTWIGMLQVDLYHTHPVALSFCHLLVQDSASNLQHSSPDVLQVCRKKRGRTKWHLAYTLINNPALILSRKQNNLAPVSNPRSRYALERLLISAVRFRRQTQTEQDTGELTKKTAPDL